MLGYNENRNFYTPACNRGVFFRAKMFCSDGNILPLEAEA